MNKKMFDGKVKSNATLISILQRVADISSIFLSCFLVSKFSNVFFYDNYLVIALLLLTTFQLIGGVTDFYRSWRGVLFTHEIRVVIQNWCLAFILSVGIINILVILKFSINHYALIFFFFIFIDLILRFMIRKISAYFRSLGYNKRMVAFAGDIKFSQTLIETFTTQNWLGLEVVGIYSARKNMTDELYKGDYNDLLKEVKKGNIDRVYLEIEMKDNQQLDWLIKELADTTCSVLFIPDIFTYNILHSRIEDINGIPVVPIFESPFSGTNKILKRIEDILFSAIILILITPLLCVISIAVKKSSPGPVFFKQTRYGVDGKPIKVWKFRTMKVMEDDHKVIQATKNDPRITRVGNFLRRTSLDELPQFINVFTGSMSIVGPRPHAVSHNEEYRKLITGYMLRHKVKPGITGWAQINGWRGETDTLHKMQKRIEFDLEYIRNWSLFFDLKIIILTVFKGFIGKNVY